MINAVFTRDALSIIIDSTYFSPPQAIFQNARDDLFHCYLFDCQKFVLITANLARVLIARSFSRKKQAKNSHKKGRDFITNFVLIQRLDFFGDLCLEPLLWSRFLFPSR